MQKEKQTNLLTITGVTMVKKIDHAKRREKINTLIGKGKMPSEIAKILGVDRPYVANQIVAMKKKGMKIPSFRKSKKATVKKATIKKSSIPKTNSSFINALNEKKYFCLILTEAMITNMLERVK